MRTITFGLCTIAIALCGCAAGGRDQDYSAELAPTSAAGPIELRLLSLRQSPSALRADLRIENRSDATLTLPATDWHASWATISLGSRTMTADVTIASNDPDQRWPYDRPLRRTLAVPPHRSVDVSLACDIAPARIGAAPAMRIVVSGQCDGHAVTIPIDIASPIVADNAR